MKLTGAYQQLDALPKSVILDILINGTSYGPAPYYGEEPYSGRMILKGTKAGMELRKED